MQTTAAQQPTETPEREAIMALLDAMEMQEKRELGECRVPRPVARRVWDDAKAKGYAVLKGGRS